MKLSVFGLGYVGSVTLACLARNGHKVVGVDIDDTKIDFINNGKSPVIEPNLDQIICEQREQGKICATSDSIETVVETDLSFICVGTPSTSNGHLDLKAIYKVSEQIGLGIKNKKAFHVIAIRSTVPPGTNEKVSEHIEQISGKTRDSDFAVVSNPEFLREGSAVHDFHNPPYILVGSQNSRAITLMKTLYEGIESAFIVTDVKIAEIIKYVNNSFHALKVAFANEVGKICKSYEIDSHKLMEIFCLDTKLNISPSYLKPGFAYGGSCLPKDLEALRTFAHDNYIHCPLLDSIERSNEIHKDMVLDIILQTEKKNIGFLGLSFKSGTDDLRGSPIIDIIERLLGKGYNTVIYDSHVHLSGLIGANKEYILNKIPYISTFLTNEPQKILENSDLVVIVNNDDEYKQILQSLPKDTAILDLVNYKFQNRDQLEYEGVAW